MLSLLVLTSPGREANLVACLQALRAQHYQDFELLIADDGSAQGQAVAHAACAGWKQPLYLWRPNDYCMSRSYNSGVAAATGEFLVLLSGDVLLNPLALTSYAASFAGLPETVIYGYFGSDKTDERDSLLIPGRRVSLRDERFDFGPDGALRCQSQMLSFPQHFAWGGNWGLPKALYQTCGGMNEAIHGWGLEDVDFANRVLERHGRLAFSLDVWAEHQIHPVQIDQAQLEQNRALVGTYWMPAEEPVLIFNPSQNRLKERLMADGEERGRGTRDAGRG